MKNNFNKIPQSTENNLEGKTIFTSIDGKIYEITKDGDNITCTEEFKAICKEIGVTPSEYYQGTELATSKILGTKPLSGQLPPPGAVESSFPELGNGKKTKSTYDDPRLQDVGDNTYTSRDDLSKPPVRKTRNITQKKPTTEVAVNLAENLGGVVANSGILAFRLTSEITIGAIKSARATNEFVVNNTKKEHRVWAICGSAIVALIFVVPPIYKHFNPKQKPDIIPTGEFLAPVTGKISSYFGKRKNPTDSSQIQKHGAIDVRKPFGTPTFAPSNGKLIKVTDKDACGNGYLFYPDEIPNTRFGMCHFSNRLIPDGGKVKKGQIIAEIGSTGHSTGPHLHLKVSKKINGKWTPVDPLENGFYEENGNLVNSIPKTSTKFAKK